MGLGHKIRELRQAKGWTLEQLEEASGVASGTIHALEARDSSRSQYFPQLARALGATVEALQNSFDVVPGISSGKPPKALEKEEGAEPEVLFSRRRSPPPQPTGRPILAWQHEEDLPPGAFAMVPRLEIKLSAGAGSDASQLEFDFDDGQLRAYSADWIRRQRLKPNKLRVMKGSGRSMEPNIYDGDDLLINLAETEIVDGKTYALWYEGGERVKRLFRLPGGGLRIRSDNERDFPEIILGPEYTGHVRIIGRVIDRSGPGGL